MWEKLLGKTVDSTHPSVSSGSPTGHHHHSFPGHHALEITVVCSAYKVLNK